ncbi:MAG: CBS and ACT domain-containing protein [Thermodesulfobacteriota bacterium]|nr:CBS and ACT domain-containing protein [Thermodesulfobacteriota bacterium]
MLVKNWMSKNVITVDINDSMQDAIKRLKENDIKMLPVMKKGKLAGIITDRDLKRASASDATSLDVHELLFLLSKIKIKDIMTKDPIMIPQDFTVEETAEILLKNKISGAPVTDNEGQVVGAITQTDLFKVLISLTGVGTKGIQFAFLLKDEPGSIKVIADEIRKHGGRMVSILTSYEGATQGFRKVYIRMYDIERTDIEKLKEELREKGTLLYVVDHKKNKREIY